MISVEVMLTNGLGGREPVNFVLGGTGDQSSAWEVA